MTARDLGTAFLKRLVVSAVVASVVLALVFGGATLTDDRESRPPLDTPEYDATTLATTPVPADGAVDPDVDARDGIVVIDRTHDNRFSRADIEPLVAGLTALGYSVRFHTGNVTLDQALAQANAFVVIDPAEAFRINEVRTVRSFTREGGHLLLVGEPTRVRISDGGRGTSVTESESALTTLAASYDMGLDTRYLYNLETNGGNYRHVTAEPTLESGLDDGRVTMFTAAPVSSRGGTVLLRAAPGTKAAGSEESRQYPVAILKPRANVVLLGDGSFLRTDRFNVGANEQFVTYLVEYLASGEETSGAAVDEARERDAADDDEETPTES